MYQNFKINNKRIYNELQHRTSTKLKGFNLLVNSSKTEYYQVPKPIPEPPKPSMEELLAHRDDKRLWSALDWLVNYTQASPKDDTPDYKKCKLLGSLLDTKTDIKRRKILAISAMKKYTKIFRSRRIIIELKIRCFQAYISSIFLYNSELWYSNRTIEEQVDSFHRKQLRFAINIHYPRTIDNHTLYAMTNVEPW